jgi:hypothetical protein
MKLFGMIASLLMALSLINPAASRADDLAWKRHVDEFGSRVDYPAGVFRQARPEREGWTYETDDRRAMLRVSKVHNEQRDSPAAFVRRQLPLKGPSLHYEHITSEFFAASARSGGQILYRRCNFVGRAIHCVLLRYPAKEKRAWDEIVTRISLSLRPR